MTAQSMTHEHWYYCVACQRVWRTATWKLQDWACPSGLHESRPEFHPHVGWSRIRGRLAGTGPTEGAHVDLLPAAVGASGAGWSAA